MAEQKSKITAILLDLGGVVVNLNHQRAVKRFEKLGLSNANELLNPYAQINIFGDLELGKTNTEDFQEQFGALVGRKVTYNECLYAWCGYMDGVPKHNLDTIKSLRSQGFRVLLASNTNSFIMQWAEKGDFDGYGNNINYYFDAMYLSYLLGVMKPNPRFFQHILEKENIHPDETIFVDDGPNNIAVANSLGMNTLQAYNLKDWTESLFCLIEMLS